jgi:hypothetical protein
VAEFCHESFYPDRSCDDAEAVVRLPLVLALAAPRFLRNVNPAKHGPTRLTLYCCALVDHAAFRAKFRVRHVKACCHKDNPGHQTKIANNHLTEVYAPTRPDREYSNPRHGSCARPATKRLQSTRRWAECNRARTIKRQEVVEEGGKENCEYERIP